MRSSHWPSLAALFLGLSIVLYDAFAQAQMYPQDIHAHSRKTGPEAPTQHSASGINAFDSAAASLQRREEEERERREMWERQRRMMENFTNIPDQLRESYFQRAGAPKYPR
jgi:hypothetical protein